MENKDKHFELASRFGIETTHRLPPISLSQHQLDLVGYRFAKHHLILPLYEEEGEIVAAIADPLNLSATEGLEMLLERSVRPLCAPEAEVMEAIEGAFRHAGEQAATLMADLETREAVDREGLEAYDLLETTEEAPLVRLLNVILREAIEQGASDIHFEPWEHQLNIRYRIDGVLQHRHTPPKEHQAHLLTRLKVMAGMDIAEHRLPQDGRIKLRMGGRSIDFRASSIPVSGATSSSERIVLRILDKGNIQLGLDHLQIPPEILKQIRRMIHTPEGILLVTGPTGSGKTTSLYSALTELTSETINIMTVEDPVEYKLAGIAQISVRHQIGMTFAKGLRHILRQDPDIVMIGEIRDQETAQIAIQSSLTGHLVLSTLHTNDAPSALTRLVDMGIEPYLLSSSVIGILAQRLVRTICPHCKQIYTPTPEELEELAMIAPQFSPTAPFYHGIGCTACFQTGYKGRQGLYELMPLTPRLQQQVTHSADAVALRQIALEEGLKTLLHHGLELIAQGVTTLTEVIRVTRGMREEIF